jgi:hypothetical protein
VLPTVCSAQLDLSSFTDALVMVDDFVRATIGENEYTKGKQMAMVTVDLSAITKRERSKGSPRKLKSGGPGSFFTSLGRQPSCKSNQPTFSSATAPDDSTCAASAAPAFAVPASAAPAALEPITEVVVAAREGTKHRVSLTVSTEGAARPPAPPSERGSAPDPVPEDEEEAAAGWAASGRAAIRRDPEAGSPTQGLTKAASIIM